jgi:hypothetical protein
MQVAFNNTKYLDELHQHSQKHPVSEKNWHVWSKTMHTHFLKIASSEDQNKINEIKIDKCNINEGCFIFFDDSRENLVIVAWDEVDVEEIVMKVGDKLDMAPQIGIQSGL